MAMIPLRLRVLDRIRGRWYPDDPDTGDLPVLLLVYLGFLLLPLVLPRFQHQHWWQTALVLALFLPLYFRGWWAQRDLPLLAIAITALALWLTPHNPGASTLIVYALAQAALLRTLVGALSLFAGIVLVYALWLWWIDFPNIVLLAALVPGIAVFVGNRSFREMQRRRAMLKLSQEEVRRLSERAERERIARDLHDLLGHTLSVIAIKAELARKLAERAPERAAMEMQQVEELARASLEEVRLALHDMRRVTLDEESAQTRLAMESAGITLSLQREELLLPPALDAALAYVLREASTNIIRHARANRATIQLRREADALLLEIADNGRGGACESGHGLRGMRERITALGGELELRSPRGAGTELRIRLPLAESTPGPLAESPWSPALQSAGGAG